MTRAVKWRKQKHDQQVIKVEVEERKCRPNAHGTLKGRKRDRRISKGEKKTALKPNRLKWGIMDTIT